MGLYMVRSDTCSRGSGQRRFLLDQADRTSPGTSLAFRSDALALADRGRRSGCSDAGCGNRIVDAGALGPVLWFVAALGEIAIYSVFPGISNTGR